MTEAVTIRSRDGLSLEAAFDLPDEPRGMVVVCHPHPGYGGTMNAPLLLALRDDLVHRGFGVLRFNFRGVGASEGASGLGEEEVADALGALDDAQERVPGVPCAFLGWSFGGAVAIRASAAADVVACVAIAPAVERKEVVAGLPSPSELGLSVPLLVVVGVHDEQISPQACAAWTEQVEGAKLVEMPGANHFFWAKYPDLTATVGGWLEQVIPATER